MYSFPLLDLIGKQTQSSVYSLLIGWYQICSYVVLMGGGISYTSSSFSGSTLKVPFYTSRWGHIFLGWLNSLQVLDHVPFDHVHFTCTIPCCILVCLSWPCLKIVLFISLSHVDLTGNPDATCMYRTSASTLGTSYALYSDIVSFLFVVWFSRKSLVGFRVKRHSIGGSFSFQPVSIFLPPSEKTVTYCLVNNNVQSAWHIGPTPTSVFVKDGMMYPVVVKYAANCRVGIVYFADELSTYQVAVPTLICEELLLQGPCGAYGEM